MFNFTNQFDDLKKFKIPPKSHERGDDKYSLADAILFACLLVVLIFLGLLIVKVLFFH